MRVRDSRDRDGLLDDGTCHIYRVRRLKCRQCGKIHIELPDFMQPFKRYESKVVEAVLDNVDESCPAEGRTIKRWRDWFLSRTVMFEAMLLALRQRLEGDATNILYPTSLLLEIRSKGIGWLSRLTRRLVNSENELHTCFAYAV